MAPRRSTSRGRPQGPGLRFDSSSPAPTRTLPPQAAVDQADLTFIRRPMRACAARPAYARIHVQSDRRFVESRSVSRSMLCSLPATALHCRVRGLGCRCMEAVGYVLRRLRGLSHSTTVLPGRRFSVTFLRKRSVRVSRTPGLDAGGRVSSNAPTCQPWTSRRRSPLRDGRRGTIGERAGGGTVRLFGIAAARCPSEKAGSPPDAARDHVRVREQPSAAPEHDWIGEQPVLVHEPGSDQIAHQPHAACGHDLPACLDFSARISSISGPRRTVVCCHSGSWSVAERRTSKRC